MHDSVVLLAEAVDAYGAGDDFAGFLECLHAGRPPDLEALLHVSEPMAGFEHRGADLAHLYVAVCALAGSYGLSVQSRELLRPHESGQVVGRSVLVAAHAPYPLLLDAVLGAVAVQWFIRQGLDVGDDRLEAYAGVATCLALRALGVEATSTVRNLALRGVTGLMVRAAAPYSVPAATQLLHDLHVATAGRYGCRAPRGDRSLPHDPAPVVEDALWATLQTCDQLRLILSDERGPHRAARVRRAADEAHAAFAGALVCTDTDPEQQTDGRP